MLLDGLKCNDARVINKTHAVLAQAWGSCFMTRSDIRIKGKRLLHDMRIPDRIGIMLYRNDPSRFRIYSM